MVNFIDHLLILLHKFKKLQTVSPFAKGKLRGICPVQFLFFVLFVFCSNILFAENKAKNEDTVTVYEVPSITVTSTRAVERESPVPFTEINKAEIRESYTVQDIPKLLADQPSIIFNSENGNGIGYSNLTMRGFDQRRISVLINGIPQNDPEDHNVYWIDFPDITSSLESIQIQRGAGLINYGAAAIGGSINLTTSNFVNKKGITLFTGLGVQELSGNSTIYKGNVSKNSVEISSGMVDNKYAFYGRLSKINSDGYRDRSWVNLNSYFLSGVRFDENFTTQINVFGGPFSDGLAYNGIPKSYITDPALRRLNPAYGGWSYDSTGKKTAYFTDRLSQEVEGFSQPHYELLNNWYVNNNLTILSALFYYTGEGYFDMDGSWADTTAYRISSDFGFHPTANPGQSIIRATVNNKQGGWIPRLVWKHGDGILTAGAEVRFHRSEHYGQIKYAENLPAGLSPDYKFYSYNGKRNAYSLFLRERYQVTEDFVFNAEAQFVNQGYSITNEKEGNLYTQYLDMQGNVVGNGGDLFNINYYFFNPRLGANYNLNKKMDIYFLAAYTSREPRLANLYSAEESYYGATPLFEYRMDTASGKVYYDFTKPLIKPEKMFDFEFGYNYYADRFKFNANIYWMEYTDELIKSGRTNIFGLPIETNADRTRHLGLELQGSVNIWEAGTSKVEVLANATISRNRIIKLDFLTSYNDKVSLEGNPIAGFPDFMGNLRVNYTTGKFYASVSGKYVGKYYSDNFGDKITTDPLIVKHLMKPDWSGAYSEYYTDNVVDGYFLFNADISYTFENFLSARSIRVLAQANNIFNTLYAGGAEGKEFFPGAERNIFIGLELGL